MKVSKKIAIILLGRPGSGKDTQAELLAKKFGLVHIISSKLIENALKTSKKTIKLGGKTYDVLRERGHAHSGALVNLNFVAALVSNEIKKIARRGRGFIASASPRSLTEMKIELPLIKSLYGRNSIYIFHVIISPEEVYERNLKRHRKDLPELDTRKIIKKRLSAFNKYTWPVIKYLKSQKMIADINGEQSIMKIHLDILKALSSNFPPDKGERKRVFNI